MINFGKDFFRIKGFFQKEDEEIIEFALSKEGKKAAKIKCSHVCDFPAMCQMPIYDKKDWLPIKKAKFESIDVNIPNNPDKILSRIYGDYMKLPPKESRFRPSPEKIDFGKY